MKCLFHQKLNGTESQRTPFSKLRSSYYILRFVLGVRETWILLEIGIECLLFNYKQVIAVTPSTEKKNRAF